MTISLSIKQVIATSMHFCTFSTEKHVIQYSITDAIRLDIIRNCVAWNIGSKYLPRKSSISTIFDNSPLYKAKAYKAPSTCSALCTLSILATINIQTYSYCLCIYKLI